jgi:hypothetical protein
MNNRDRRLLDELHNLLLTGKKDREVIAKALKLKDIEITTEDLLEVFD